MRFRDKDKEAIKQNAYTTLSKIYINGTNYVFTENDAIVSWEYEDYRYVPNNGFIGQFVERILDGSLKDVPSNIILENTEINLQIGIVNRLDNITTWYDYGNFIITNVGETDTSGVFKFESSDYTKKFNSVFENKISYPCLALELANNACDQVGVELYHSDLGFCYTPDVDEVLEAGTYCITAHNEYDETETKYEFTTTKDLKYKDSLLLTVKDKKVVQKIIDNDFKIQREDLPAVVNDESEATEITARETKYNDFVNNDFVVIDNQFEEDETCRDVIKSVAKLAYCWARVGEDDKVHLDFTRKDENDVEEADVLTTDEYYESEKRDLVYGPVNKVLVGMSQVEGENVVKEQNAYEITNNVVYGNSEQETNGQMPSPDYPSEIKSVGIRNICNQVSANKSSSRTGVIEITNTQYLGLEDKILVKPNTTYTIKFKDFEDLKLTSNFSFNYSTYNSSGTFIERKTGVSTTITTGDNVYYIFPYYFSNNSVFTNTGGIVMVEEGTTSHDYVPYGNWIVQKTKGSTATDYEPYKENKILVDMNIYNEKKENIGYYELNKIGNVFDELDAKNGILTKRIGKVVLDGSESWIEGVTSNNIRAYKTSFNNCSYGRLPYQYLSDRYMQKKSGNFENEGLITVSATSNDTYLFASTSYAENVSKLKTWLSNNPVTVYYVLAEPETIKLEKQEIKLLPGKNSITIESNIEPSKIKISVKDIKQDVITYESSSYPMEIDSEVYEECSIDIYDNPLTYTEELRRIAINGCERLLGIEYMPLKMKTIGHPWLDGDSYIKLTNLDNEVLHTYAFDRKLCYNGYIVSEISSDAETRISHEYENPSNIIRRLTHAEIQVDKNANEIRSMVSEVTDAKRLSVDTQTTVNGMTTTISDIQTDNKNLGDRITTVETTLNGIKTEKNIIGGSNLIKNSVGYFGSDYWEVAKDQPGNIYSDNSSDTKANSISGSALVLKHENVSQRISAIKPGTYWINFSYKKIRAAATCKVTINGVDTVLTETTWTKISKKLDIKDTYIEIVLSSSLDDSCMITDLMLSAGDVEVSWSQNSNETYTDTVKIGKGVYITATGSDTSFSAQASGIEIQNVDSGQATSVFDKYGTTTNQLTVKGSATVESSLIIKKVGDQIWFSTID